MLSFIIPTYNRKDYLKRCIDSIISQKVKNFEIIVVDDNSTDNTYEFIKENYSFVKIIRNEKNLGPANSRNIGFENSSGDYIMFIDSDVYLQENCIKNLAKYNSDIVYPLIKFDSGLRMYPSREKEKKYLYVTTVFLAKRDSLKKLDSLFDPNYLFNYEDLDFFIRCNYFNLEMKFCQEAMAVHAEHKTQEDWEKRHYCELYGILYGMLKLKKLLKNSKMENDFNFNILSKKLICSLFNFNPAHYYIEYGNTSVNKKIKDILFDKKRKISNKGILHVYYLTLKAFYKSFIDLPKTFEQKKKLENYIKQSPVYFS